MRPELLRARCLRIRRYRAKRMWRARPWLRARNGMEHFQADTAWRWQIQLKAERLVSPARVVVVAVNTAIWATRPHPAGSAVVLAWLLVAAAWGYVLADLVLVYVRADLAARLPAGSSILDLVFTFSWIAATGGTHSLFLPMAFLGAATAPLRLPTSWAFAFSAAYALLYAALASPAQRFAAVYVLCASAVLAIWTAVTRHDRQSSLRDPLTGCYGRQYAMFSVEQAVARRGEPFHLGLLDLDGFKRVNDVHGHGAGDVVLQQACHVIAGALTGGHILARYGGDEFMLLLRNADGATAKAVAERVRTAVAQSPFIVRMDQPVIRLTASIGLAAARPDLSIGQLVELADRRLYAAKAYRDRVAWNGDAS